MTKKNEFVRKKDVNLTEGFLEATKHFKEFESKNLNSKELREKGKKLLEQYKSGKHTKKLEMIKVIERNMAIFQEIETNFEDIVLGLEKVYGSDEVSFSLYWFKVRHSCFHTDLGYNTIACNPKINRVFQMSSVELSTALERNWGSFYEQMRTLTKTEGMDVILEAYYEELIPNLKEHKDQLKYMRNILPRSISRVRVDPRPHLNIEVGWDLNGQNEGVFYSDILDLTNSLKDESLLYELYNLPFQLVHPITVEANRWEVIPLIIPTLLEEKFPDLVEVIEDKIEKRLQGVGEVTIGGKVKYEPKLSNIAYGSPNILIKLMKRNIAGYDIQIINELLGTHVFKVNNIINCGIENYSGSGNLNEIKNVIAERDKMFIKSMLTGKNLSHQEEFYIPDELRKKYVKKFKDIKV